MKQCKTLTSSYLVSHYFLNQIVTASNEDDKHTPHNRVHTTKASTLRVKVGISSYFFLIVCKIQQNTKINKC